MTLRKPSLQPFAKRRRRLLRHVSGGIAVVATAPVATYSGDVSHPFRPDSDFYYLTGLDEPEAVAVLVPGHRQGAYWLFVRPRAPEREMWDGPRTGLVEARTLHGADVSLPLDDLGPTLVQLLGKASVLHHSAGRNPDVDRVVRRALGRARRRRGGQQLSVEELAPAVHAMRLLKSASEQRLLSRAANITCAAHRVAMGAVVPGCREYEIEAVLAHEFRRRGAAGPAYASIVGSGPNACVLHHVRNRRRMRAGELLLVDAGCEFGYYNADVTRTVPVGGRFSRPQRQIYDLVLAAQLAAIREVAPGRAFMRAHDAAVEVLADGMARLGLLQGSAAEIVESGSYRRYFVHRTSHWLGMDVHDVGPRTRAGRGPMLRPGMVLTVEPGLYIPPADLRVPPIYRGLGVRIEDDVLVTPDGCRVLTASLPKRATAVERLVRSG